MASPYSADELYSTQHLNLELRSRHTPWSNVEIDASFPQWFYALIRPTEGNVVSCVAPFHSISHDCGCDHARERFVSADGERALHLSK